MPRRSIWSARQRAALFDLPTDEAALLRHYTLSDDDIEHIRVRRGGHNRLGFALQLCAFRYPGRILVAGEVIPLNVLRFIAAQLGMRAEDLDGYAVREETRREHIAEIRRIYGYRMFSGRCTRDLKVWLENEVEAARSNEGLARQFVEECRRRQVILPGLSVLERLCAGALVAAERRIETRIAAGLDDAMRMRLDRLLTEEVDGGVSRFVWLRRFEVGRNSAGINGLLDRLEFLQGFDLPSDLLETVPPHRVARLRRQGERYFTDGLRDISGDRRLAILAVCAVEWRGAVADAVVETHDRIVGQTFRSARRRCDARLQDSRAVLHDTLDAFRTLGAALLEAKGDGAPLEEAVAAAGGWQRLEGVVAAAEQLSDTMSADPLAHVVQGWPRFRRYAPRMLRALDIQTSRVGEPILAALRAIGAGSHDMPRIFPRRNSRWHQHLNARPTGDRRLWEVAALFHMRDAFRSGDIWLAHSRRYGDVKRALVPIEAAHATARLAVPFEPREWLAEHKAHLVGGLDRLADAARHCRIPGGAIENGELRIGRPASAVPEDVDELVLDLYRRLPEVRITGILLEVDAATGFTDAFTHLRTGAPCKDRIGLLNVLLAEGLNLGLSKMAEASNTHDLYQLSRLSRWHIESEAINRALAMVRGTGTAAHGPLLGPGPYRLQRRPVLPGRTPGRSDEPRQRPLWQRTGPQGLYPRLGPVRTLRNADHPGHGQRSALYSRRVADDQGWAAHPRAIRRHRRFHRPCVRRHIPARLSVHPPHPGPAVETAACLRAQTRSEAPDRIDRQQNPGGRDRAELARHPAVCCHPGQWRPSA